MVIKPIYRRDFLPYVTGLMVMITLLYHHWLYPLLLEPIGERYTLNDLVWQGNSSPDCQAEGCRLQASGQRVHAIAWIASQGAGHFALEYALRIDVDDWAGAGGQKGGRIALFPEYQGRLSWDMPHLFFDEQGQGRWHGRALLHFSAPVDRFQLSAELRALHGTMEIQQLRLQEFRETRVLRAILAVLAVVWLVLAIYGQRWLAAGQGTRHWSLLAVYLLIVAGTQVPNNWFKPLRDLLVGPAAMQQVAPASGRGGEQTDQVERSNRADGGLRLTWVKKIAHGLLFAALVVLLRRRMGAESPLVGVLLPAALLAAATEAAQGLGVTRTPSVADWGIDMLGCAAGLLLLRLKLLREKYRYRC